MVWVRYIMIDKMIDVLEQNSEEFEYSDAKNLYISSTESEWIGFVDKDVTNRGEICQILEDNPFLMDYDVILFGNDVPEGECDCLRLLGYPQSNIFALIFKRELLIRTGPYNRFLTGNSNYEFVLRLAFHGSVYSIPCDADKAVDFHPLTMAYIVRRYMELLKKNEVLNKIFLRIVQEAERSGKVAEFNKVMTLFLADEGEYERILTDTAPCLIMVSNDIAWYGVVDGFANALADELVRLGQAVVTTNDRYGDYHNLPKELLLNQVYKAIIGFQASALQSETFRNMKGARYQFWLDDPMFSIDFFRRTPKQMYILCQDAYYAEFLRKHLYLGNAKQFPPAGVQIGELHKERELDLVFIGSYLSLPKANYEDVFRREFYQYMLLHTDATVEQGIRNTWQKQGVQYQEDKFMQTLESLRDVCYNLLEVYRHRVVEAILSAGIHLHVFGDSWKKYQGNGCENLIIHPKVMVEESLQIWSQTKIGLNIMNGHKAGMTERIANIMLCGACCLSDETSFLREHFCDGEDIVLFSAERLDQLVMKIQYLLHHDDEREKIAYAGYEKALREHTWRNRAEELLAIINDEVNMR